MKRRPASTAHQFVVPATAAGATLVESLARFVRDLSPRAARLAVDQGCVFVGRRRVKEPELALAAGQLVTAHLGAAFERSLRMGPTPAPTIREPSVLFEDEELLVVVKPAGLLTAPTPEGDQSDLATALRARAPRVYVVHRLDLMTSGVLVFAKTPRANRALSETFRTHDLKRQYDAFVAGSYPVDAESIRVPLGGKAAVSHVRVIARLREVTRLRVTLETGRTHQIRRHLAWRGTPVLGDGKYGESAGPAPPRMALHARVLSFTHPVTGTALHFDVPLPDDLSNWLQALERE